jgi:hypothetical protein
MNDEQFTEISQLLERQINRTSSFGTELVVVTYYVGYFLAFGMNWASRDWATDDYVRNGLSNLLELIPVVLWSLLSWVNVGSFLVN